MMQATKRGSFTIPANEMDNLENLPKRFKSIEPTLNKSEIIRIGIHQVGQLDTDTVNRILTSELGRLTVGKPSPRITDDRENMPDLVISDTQWLRLHPLLGNSEGSRGRPSYDNRKVLDAILFIFREKTQNRDVPRHLVSYRTAMRRLKYWKTAGLWLKICRTLSDNPTPQSVRKHFSEILLRTLINVTERDNIS